MAVYGNYQDCYVIVYDKFGNELIKTQITDHNTDTSIIEVSGFIKHDESEHLSLLVLSSPAPLSYLGTLKRSGMVTSDIAIFKGQKKEDRSSIRHKINASALLDNLQEHIVNKSFPLEVELIDISQSGTRFRGKRGILRIGDKFRMHIINSAVGHSLVAEVKNSRDADIWNVEYGCRFLKID